MNIIKTEKTLSRVQKLISAYVNENFHVSFMITFYFELTNIYTERETSFKEYILLFFLTFLAYGYLRKPNNTAKKRLNLFFCCTCLIGISYTIIYFIYLDFINKFLIIILSCLCFFYKNPILSIESLRRNPIIKILTISFSWTILTCVFLNPNLPKISKFEVFHFFERLFFLISIYLVFEINDYDDDSSFQMSFPNKYGITITRILATLFTYVSLFFLFQGFKDFSLYTISILTMSLLTQISILTVKPKSDFYFTRLWTEAMPIVPFVILKVNLFINFF